MQNLSLFIEFSISSTCTSAVHLTGLFNIRNNRNLIQRMTTFLLSFSIYSLHQACMSNTGPEEKVHERISAAPSNRSLTISQRVRRNTSSQTLGHKTSAEMTRIKNRLCICVLKKEILSLSFFFFFQNW